MNWINSTNAKETITLYLLRLKNKIFINSNLSLFEVNYLFEIFAPILTPFIPFIITFIHMFALFKDSQNLGLGRALGLGIGISISFYFKLFFVFFLIFVNVYLVLSHNKEEPYTDINKLQVLHSGPGGKNPRNWLYVLAGAVANISGLIAIKNEARDQNLGRYKAEKTKIMEEIKIERAKLEAEKIKLVEIQLDIAEQRRELIWLHGEKVKHTAAYLRLNELNETVYESIELINRTAEEAKLELASSESEEPIPSILKAKCDYLKRNIGKYEAELLSIDDEVGSSSTNRNLIWDKADREKDRASIEGSEIKKSNIINFDFSIDWFEGLGGIQKLAVGIILGKSVIFSALISIFLIFYGNILLDKYDILKNYPRLGKIIELRKKYQKYYFMYSCLLILIVVIQEFVLGFLLLLISF